MKRIVLLGKDIQHSLSPIIHNAAFRALGLANEYRYDLLPVTERKLAEVVHLLIDGGLEGANVTIPYKRRIMDHIQEIDNVARQVGSVNTLYRDQGTVKGCNSDMQGFVNVLIELGIETDGITACVLGAGGAARAVVFALAKRNVEEIRVYNRSISNARQLADDIQQQFALDITVHSYPITENLNGIDLLVNCTPVGMDGHSVGYTPVGKKHLHDNMVVMDLIYNPLKSRLLQDAEQVGCRIIDGTHLLVHQGAISFKKWTGLRPPTDVMHSHLLQALEGASS